MIVQTIPQFLTTDIEKTLAYFADKLGFATDFKYGEPAFYGAAGRDGCQIFFRQVDEVPKRPQADYDADMIDAYITVTDTKAMAEEFKGKGVTLHHDVVDQPYAMREIIVRDIDDRLICFGQDTSEG